jgi:iron complex outermembrane receptor protein
MSLRKTALLVLALQVHMLAHTQDKCNALFMGRIVNELNQPMIGAAIVLLPEQSGQHADNSGGFLFENICPGMYTVKVRYLGYHDVEFSLQIDSTVSRIIHLTQAASEIDEIVIQHHDVTLTEHANNFVQIDQRVLTESAGKNLGDILEKISGVNSIQTGPGISKPVIHGVHSQRILILNYGIRQEGQQWGAEHAPEIDPFIASNIVVIKDASAIKYGTDALGGVIVVNPPSLPEQAGLGGTFHTVLQSNGRSGTFSGMLEGGVKNHEGWGWRIQSSGKKTGDFETPRYVLSNTGIREFNFSASAGYHKENKGFDIFFSRFQTEIGILKGTSIGNLDDLVAAMERDKPQYTSDFSYRIGEPRQEVSHNLLKINGHSKTRTGEWRLQYGFQNNNRKEYDVRRGELSKIPSIDLQLNTHTLDGEWETLHSRKGTFSFGANAMLQDNKNIFGTQRIPFIPNFESISAGTFGITKLHFNQWTFDLGARYDYRKYDVRGYDFKNTFYTTSFNFNNVSATAGASVQLKNEQTVHINLSSAWRPPHVAELFSIGTHQSAGAIEYGLLLNDTTNEILNIADIDFKTEQAAKLVATYQKRWRTFTIEVSPFANYIFNYIYLQPRGVTQNLRGVYPYFRYAQTDALFVGADISATCKIGKYVGVTPQVSLLRARDDRNDDFLISIPSNRYQISIRYERPAMGFFKNFYIGSEIKYTARQRAAPRVITVRRIKESLEQETDPFDNNTLTFDFKQAPDGYTLVNLLAGVSIKRKTIQYDFRIASENTLNERYREYTNRFRYYSDDVGRNLIFSLKCLF